MANLRIGKTTWLPAAAPERRLDQSKARIVGPFGRTMGLVALVLGLGFTAIGSATRADQSRPIGVPALPAPVMAGDSKDRSSDLGFAEMFLRTNAVGPVSRFSASGGGVLSASAFVAASRQPARWTEQEFASVTVIDGRTLQAGDMRIRLLELDLPMPEQVCRTLDGRLERCVARAATQLELLTRWKRVTCHYRLASANDGIGRCRIGSSDLAERMVMTGYAWRSATPVGPS